MRATHLRLRLRRFRKSRLLVLDQLRPNLSRNLAARVLHWARVGFLLDDVGLGQVRREVLVGLHVGRVLPWDLHPIGAPLRRELGADLVHVRQEQVTNAPGCSPWC